MKIKKIKIVRRKKEITVALIYRPITDYLTNVLVRTKINPNSITSFSIIMGLISGIFFGFGEKPYLFLGVIFSQVALILDLVDGEIARTKKMTSEFGAWYDMIANKIFKYFMFLGAMIGAYRISNDPSILIVGSIAIFNITIISYISNLRVSFNFSKNYSELPEIKGLTIPFGLLVIIILDIFAIFNKVSFALWFFAIFGTFGWIKQIYSHYKLGNPIKIKG